MKWFHLFMMKPISKLLGFLWSKDGAVFSFGMAAHLYANFVVNVLLAGYAALHMSLLDTLMLVFCASIIKIIVLVKIYDHFKTDIFGIELAKNGQVDNKVVRIIKRILHHLEHRSKFFTHVVLVAIDHIFGVIYIRREHHVYRGIPWQDWPAILLAVLISTPAIVLGWKLLILAYSAICWVLRYITNFVF